MGVWIVGAYRVARDTQITRVTTIKEKPFLFVKDENAEGNDKFEGYIPDLMEKIKKKTGIHYNLIPVQDGEYGSLDESTSRWSGMIGEVKYGRADLIAAPMTISDDRKEVVDFTSPFMSFHTVLLLKKPASGEESPVKSAEDLVDQTEIKYGLVGGGSTENFFETTKDPTFKKMWQEMRKDPSLLATSAADGVKRVRDGDGKYVFIMEGIVADYWIHQEPCDLIKVEDEIKEKHYGFGMEKGSKLKSQIDPVINELKQNGDLEALRKKWWDEKSECETGGSGHLTAFPLALITAAFLALGFN